MDYIIYSDHCDVFHTAVAAICGAWLYCAGGNTELVSVGDVRLDSSELWFTRTERIEEVNIEKLITALEVDEGCKFEIYNDHLGYATFGIGHLVTQDDPEFGQPLGTPVSEERVREVFEKDVDRVRLDCLKLYPDFNDLPEDAQLIIANMMFNMGLPRLSTFKRMKAAVDDRDWESAANEMESSRWYRQVPNRAERLIEKMRLLAVPV